MNLSLRYSFHFSEFCDGILGSKCYYVSRRTLLIRDAYNNCKERGGLVALIPNAEVNDLVQKIAKG